MLGDAVDKVRSESNKIIRFCENFPEYTASLWSAHHRYVFPILVDCIVINRELLTSISVMALMGEFFDELLKYGQWDFPKARFCLHWLNKAYDAAEDLDEEQKKLLLNSLNELKIKYLQPLPTFTLKSLCTDTLNRYLFLKEQAIIRAPKDVADIITSASAPLLSQ